MLYLCRTNHTHSSKRYSTHSVQPIRNKSRSSGSSNSDWIMRLEKNCLIRKSTLICNLRFSSSSFSDKNTIFSPSPSSSFSCTSFSTFIHHHQCLLLLENRAFSSWKVNRYTFAWGLEFSVGVHTVWSEEKKVISFIIGPMENPDWSNKQREKIKNKPQ